MLNIAVHSAYRTKARTVRPANYLHGNGQNHLLPHEISKAHTLARKETYLQFVFPNLNLFLPGDFLYWPVWQVEINFNRHLNLRQASIASRFQNTGNVPTNSDFPSRQFRHRIHCQRSCLVELGPLIIKITGGVGLRYRYSVKFELLKSDKHFGLTVLKV